MPEGLPIAHSGVIALTVLLRLTVPPRSRAGPGNGVAVLLKINAHCIDGQATAANQRIADALGTQDAEEDLGDEGDGDTEQAS